LLIANVCSGFCFLDGSTYAPLFHRTVPNECEWHRVNPALMICVSDNEIYTWNPRLDIKTAVYVFDEYKHLQFGPYNAHVVRVEHYGAQQRRQCIGNRRFARAGQPP